MDQQYLTVKQFADRAGVSTQRIYQLLTKSLQEFCKTENGIKYISIEGLKVFDKKPLQEVARDLQSPLQGVARDLQSDLKGVASPETELLKETIEALRQQLTVKDEQLAEKDRHISDLTAALVAAQEQHKTLTGALTAAQALHAGTLQERLTDQKGASGEPHREAAVAEDVSVTEYPAPEPEQTEEQPKLKWWQRLFHRS